MRQTRLLWSAVPRHRFRRTASAVRPVSAGTRGAVEPSHSNTHLRPQLLQVLQQLPFDQSDRGQLLQNPQQLAGPRSVNRKFRTTAARANPEQEYEKYQRLLDTQPSPVEQHFDGAVKKAKQLEQPKKKTVKNPEGDK